MRGKVCKHPLKGFPIGIHEKTGKPNYLICSYSVNHLEWRFGRLEKCDREFISPYADKVVKDFVEIPCGHCVDCKLQYSKQWAARCMLEKENYPDELCWFLTLTYDNAHVLYSDLDGFFIASLSKEDLQKFWKRLRRDYEYHDQIDKIRYYACGEYGENTHRPHYHAIVYGLPVKDLVPWSKSKSGFLLYRSERLEKIWGNGFVTLSPVTMETCAYTARYVIKKVGGFTNDDYLNMGVEPEFVVMSRRPGIASEYYERYRDDIYKYDEIILKKYDGGIKLKPPKYYDSKYEKDMPEAYEAIKEKRKFVSENIRSLKMCHTDKSYIELLAAEEQNLIRRLKGLCRSNYEGDTL